MVLLLNVIKVKEMGDSFPTFLTLFIATLFGNLRAYWGRSPYSTSG